MWLKRFKIALAESDVNHIDELIQSVPTFHIVSEMTEALYLIKEARNLMQDLQNNNQKIKTKLSKHIEFIQSTKNEIPSTLNTLH